MSNLAGHVWQTLAAIDLTAQKDQKGKLAYLSWAWAWGTLMNHFPDTSYEFTDRTFPDGTMEINCTVTITEGEESVSRFMWLAVMDNYNKGISNPDSTAINKSKMRCLTKCLGMFGLGHYIYAGEDLPDQEVVVKAREVKQVAINADYNAVYEEHKTSVQVVKQGIAADELTAAAEAWFELTENVQRALWKAHSKGGCFTTSEQKIIRSHEFKVAYFGETIEAA